MPDQVGRTDRFGKSLSAGDRVVIVDREHPWHGHAGELRLTTTVLFPWAVELDNGHSCCVDEKDVRCV